MLYKFTMEEDGNEWVVSFADVPEAVTRVSDENLGAAVDRASDIFIATIKFYYEQKRLIPLPSPLNEDDDFIAIPIGMAAKILLLNEILESGISQAELGRFLGIKRQNMQRVVDLKHPTKIETLEEAMMFLGKRFEVISVK